MKKKNINIFPCPRKLFSPPKSLFWVTVEEWYSAWTNEMKGHQWSITFRDLMFLLEDATGSIPQLNIPKNA
ncbi:hypothetical protein Avbf_17403 [Armadillidium vulgare]|nr:hypothetical protein Avbf_17403 [Armadillidium vulgare]